MKIENIQMSLKNKHKFVKFNLKTVFPYFSTLGMSPCRGDGA